MRRLVFLTGCAWLCASRRSPSPLRLRAARRFSASKEDAVSVRGGGSRGLAAASVRGGASRKVCVLMLMSDTGAWL